MDSLEDCQFAIADCQFEDLRQLAIGNWQLAMEELAIGNRQLAML
jgi:hypothetical protein